MLLLSSLARDSNGEAPEAEEREISEVPQ